MPANFANITIKKNDGTTDVLYTAESPAAGDGSDALWRNKTVGSAVEHHPELRLRSKDRVGSRQMVGNYHYPQIATNTTTTLTSVVNKSKMRVEIDLAKGMPQADLDEFVSQGTNLLVSAIIRACLKAGTSAS